MVNIIQLDESGKVKSVKSVGDSYELQLDDIQVDNYEDYKLGDTYPKEESA